MAKSAVEANLESEGTKGVGSNQDKLLKFMENTYDFEEWKNLIDQMNELRSISKKNIEWKKKMKDCSNFDELEKKLNQLSILMGIETLNTLLF